MQTCVCSKNWENTPPMVRRARMWSGGVVLRTAVRVQRGGSGASGVTACRVREVNRDDG